ncbi:unnamed protein product [Clonostachys rhizophaga]|uniref:Amino acid transporter transmembrane domain-containing protein n=1 Tax=Clonostachys rhizophaga TaxID=160324 RepID=A0A9N9VRU2_9HYPO|nr:unnamed protein product [Clonostachys rhizophaga]
MEESKRDHLHEDPEDPLAKSIANGQTVTEDAVFGDITAEGPKHRSVGWVGTVIKMMKLCIGLGILSIPATFDAFGICGYSYRIIDS